ncbi:autoinducer synthase [Hoeflea sp. G2-23]|uniref:Acyl-homoserine-lactone synthase n=1 Tax=Hoeflea algicola TaxID=2983763 RepID=A0ABT3Z6C6_9HYPH|nr:acyl-homoserine-lactone synthase [Hoeflea algicola]MCY0147326.1 autoinducer synthase [Hoeflea algicola]
MIEAHVVNAENKHLYAHAFEQFRRRHHDCCALTHRRKPVNNNGLESDPFDTPQAIYLLGMLEDRVVTSARLVPTTIANPVAGELADMCENMDLPCRADWAAWTRTDVLPEYREAGVTGIPSQMFCAVMEYCLDEGISHTGGMLQQFVLKRWLDLGWKVIPAGLPRILSGDWCLLAYVEVGEKALRAGRARAAVNRPLVVRRGAQLPFINPSQSPASLVATQ